MSTQGPYKVGIIQQMMVPDGVLNMTTSAHDVYPGTIRRTVIERDGHLFIYTSGAGQNNFNNFGKSPFFPDVRNAIQIGGAFGNDKYGPLAFKALDHQAFKYVQSIRMQRK